MHVTIEGACPNQVNVIVARLSDKISCHKIIRFKIDDIPGGDRDVLRKHLDEQMNIVQQAIEQHSGRRRVILQAHSPLYPTIKWLNSQQSTIKQAEIVIRNAIRGYDSPDLFVLLQNGTNNGWPAIFDPKLKTLEGHMFFMVEGTGYGSHSQAGVLYGNRHSNEVASDILQLTRSLR